MLGKAAVAMWWDVAAEARAEWEEWHTVEHMLERLAIPGFLRGTRWIAASGEPSYFVLYETSGIDVITTGAYLERLNNPTPWSQKMMPHHRNMVRSLCTVEENWGGGVPHTLATLRASARPRLPPHANGLTSLQLLKSRPITGPQTAEQKIRGGDASADWILLIGGYDSQAVRNAIVPQGTTGFYRPAYSLSAGEIS